MFSCHVVSYGRFVKENIGLPDRSTIIMLWLVNDASPFIIHDKSGKRLRYFFRAKEMTMYFIYNIDV